MAPQGDGKPLRDHLEAVEHTTGRRPPELDLPPIPKAGAEVWTWFCDLAAGRQLSGFGASPISYHDMHSYFALIGQLPGRWEMLMLRQLDREALAVMQDNKPKSGTPIAPPITRRSR